MSRLPQLPQLQQAGNLSGEGVAAGAEHIPGAAPLPGAAAGQQSSGMMGLGSFLGEDLGNGRDASLSPCTVAVGVRYRYLTCCACGFMLGNMAVEVLAIALPQVAKSCWCSRGNVRE